MKTEGESCGYWDFPGITVYFSVDDAHYIFFRVPKALHRFQQPWICCGSYRNWSYQSATYGITLWPIDSTIVLV